MPVRNREEVRHDARCGRSSFRIPVPVHSFLRQVPVLENVQTGQSEREPAGAGRPLSCKETWRSSCGLDMFRRLAFEMNATEPGQLIRRNRGPPPGSILLCCQ